MGVADDLHLDVAWPDDVFFEDDGVVAERGEGFASGAGHGLFEFT